MWTDTDFEGYRIRTRTVTYSSDSSARLSMLHAGHRRICIHRKGSGIAFSIFFFCEFVRCDYWGLMGSGFGLWRLMSSIIDTRSDCPSPGRCEGSVCGLISHIFRFGLSGMTPDL